MNLREFSKCFVVQETKTKKWVNLYKVLTEKDYLKMEKIIKEDKSFKAGKRI